MGRVFFTRCDFRALRQDFSLEPLDLYRVFAPENFARVAKLHDFLSARGYQAEVSIYNKPS